MNKATYEQIENYMISCMQDSAHDKEHVYRVLYTALHLAKFEKDVDYDVLITACLLHDIGRQAQAKNQNICHAKAGGNMAMDYLLSCGWSNQNSLHVKKCIQSHRFRSSNPPESIEAKIVFDADKLEAAGALGIARTLIYLGQAGESIYTTDERGKICVGLSASDPDSFYKEFNRKLKSIYDLFYTNEGKRLAKQRKETAYTYFKNLQEEVNSAYELKDTLSSLLLK